MTVKTVEISNLTPSFHHQTPEKLLQGAESFHLHEPVENKRTDPLQGTLPIIDLNPGLLFFPPLSSFLP